MDTDRIAGSAKDFAGKVESAAGDIAGDAKTQASGRAREAAGGITHRPSLQSLLAERELARELGADCHTPLGAWAKADRNGELLMRAARSTFVQPILISPGIASLVRT